MDEKGLVEIIIDGLCTDGDHHKQWYLERVLRELVGDEEFDNMKGISEWEEGIAP